MFRRDVEEFIRASANIDPPSGLVDALYRRTEGNPLFLTEVVRRMSQAGELIEGAVEERRNWTMRVPDGIQELVHQRLRRLSNRSGAILRVAAVIGHEFDVSLLERLDEKASGEELVAALEEGMAARIVEEVPETTGHYQFTHALLQETLAAQVSPSRRTQMEKLVSGARVAELAQQFGGPAASTGPQTSVREALAGERALANNAYEEAIGHFERALVPQDGEEMTAESAALLFGLGRAQAATMEVSKLHSAVSNLGRAFDYFAQAGDVERAISVADHLPAAKGTADVLARALTLVGPDSYEAGRVLPTYGLSLGIEEGNYEGAQSALDTARAIAEKRQDAVLDMKALARAAYVDAHHLRLREGVEKGLKAIELARRVSDPLSEVMARFVVATAMYVMGDAEAATLHAASSLTVAEKVRERQWQAAAYWINETVSRLRGKWSEARASSHRGLSARPMDMRLLGTRTLLEYETGEAAQGDLFIRRLLEAMRAATEASITGQAFPALVLPLAARISMKTSRLEAAVEAAEALLSSSTAPPQISIMARAGLGVAAVISGDPNQAEQHYGALGVVKESMMPVGMAGDRLLGLLAMTKGSMDEAVGHFDDSLAFCLRAWYRPEYAWSCHDSAEALLQRDAEGDSERARSLLEQSLGIARELGMRPLGERVEARLG